MRRRASAASAQRALHSATALIAVSSFAICCAQGNRATPAYLSFTAKERVVGEAAYNHQHLNQAHTIYHAKSMLGYDYADPAFQAILAASKFPFTVSEGANKRPVVEVELQGKPVQFSPEELVGVLFKQIKQTASQYMGFAIEKAVISVPTHYNERQKAALLEAARLGELQVLSLCNEPAAVAMAYKLDEPPSSGAAAASHQNVVVVDMGGMATNISVMGVQNGIMELLGGDQDTHVRSHTERTLQCAMRHHSAVFSLVLTLCLCASVSSAESSWEASTSTRSSLSISLLSSSARTTAWI